MKLYIATAWSNRHVARSAMEACRAAGHEIAHDWTREEPPMSIEHADACAVAVECCEALILLDHAECRGSYIEVGLALSRRRVPVIVVGSLRHCVFWLSPRVKQAKTLAEALAALDLASGRE